MRRIQFLRARNRPVGDFFTFIEAPQQQGGSLTRPNTRSRDSGLRPIPFDQQRRGGARATDVDSQGRRLGGSDPDDVNGDVTEKDVLPAYEVKGGPPNYSQFLAVNLRTDANTSLQVTSTAPVGTSPQSRPVEASSRTTNSSTQPSLGFDVQLPPPPPPSYSPVSATARLTMPPTNPLPL